MPGPLIESKVRVPRRRDGDVPRPRLNDRLTRGARSRLTLISAPAGFGKTTLVADWLASSMADRSCAWVSLDTRDNDPVLFWRYVVAALQVAVPGFATSAVQMLESESVPLDAALATLVNDLGGGTGELVLVLDDFHAIEASEVRDQVTLMLEHLPPHVHLVIATRADPAVSLARLRARGDLVEIRAADLRFTSAEAADYLRGPMGLALDVRDIATLEARTEGWIAALQLAALSMQGRDDVAGFIAGFAGDDRYIVDYLVEEVLQRQSDPVRGFLLQTAVLGRLEGSLCDAVTGRDDGKATLDAIDRSNLFLIPLDDRRQWYRYHHLFADVLGARLLDEQPDLVPLLHQRASRWYEAHDSVEEAVWHALAARDFDRAAYLMELAVPAIRRNRQEATLLGWLKTLPDAVVRRSPVLNVFAGFLLMVSGDLDGFEPRLEEAERALAAVPDGSPLPWAWTEELDTLPATIALYRASLAQARGDVAGTAEHARHALSLARPGDHLARGGAAGFLGLATWAQGDVAGALETFTHAVASLHAAGNRVDELSSTVILADMRLASGRPSTARRLYLSALGVAEARGGPVLRATSDLLVGLSELDYEAGDLEGAERHLNRATALGEGASMTESRFRWFLVRGRVAAAEGDPQGAIAFLDQAEQLYRPGFFLDLRPVAATRARVWIAHGNLSEAAAWAQQRGVSVTDDAAYLSEFDHLTLVRLLVAQHRAHPDGGSMLRAVGLLDRLLEAAETSGRAGSLVEILMLQALAQDAQGLRPQACATLGRALTEAPEPEGYARLFLDEGALMVGLLRDVQRRGLGDHHPSRILNLGAPRDDDPARPGQGLVAALADPLSAREVQVLRLLGTELSGPQIAAELFVSQNTLRTHTKHIFTKLDVTSRRAAVRRARELGLL